MRLRHLDVADFRGIRQASVIFGRGLTVLHGPNELGKSTLVEAIRAALFVQYSSQAGHDFVTWGGAKPACVTLTFEHEGVLWRVSKRFGPRAAAALESSEDVEPPRFREVVAGRGVEGRLRELLAWGIAAPAARGASPKAESFLLTALLGKQGEVQAILDASLDDDRDETGKSLVTRAMGALDGDPLVRRIIDRLTTRVESIFTSQGEFKTAADSPLVKLQQHLRAQERLLQTLRSDEEAGATIRQTVVRLQDEQQRLRADVDAAKSVADAAAAHAERVRARAALDAEVDRLRAQNIAKATAQLDDARQRQQAERDTLDAADAELLLLQAVDSHLAIEEQRAMVRALEEDADRARDLRARAEAMRTEASAIERQVTDRTLPTRERVDAWRALDADLRAHPVPASAPASAILPAVLIFIGTFIISAAIAYLSGVLTPVAAALAGVIVGGVAGGVAWAVSERAVRARLADYDLRVRRRDRWTQEVEPSLRAASLTTLADYERAVADVERRRSDVRRLRDEADLADRNASEAARDAARLASCRDALARLEREAPGVDPHTVAARVARTRDRAEAVEAREAAAHARDRARRAYDECARNIAVAEQMLRDAHETPLSTPDEHRDQVPDTLPFDLTEAREALEAVQARLERCTNDLNHAKGQLHLVAGHVGSERLAQQEDVVRVARDEVRERERSERAALRLLRELEAVEAERAAHLGRAMAGPVTEAFHELTGGRYSAIRVTPGLRTEHVEAQGGDRSQERLSVGAREQLATLLRLAIAGYLRTAVVLDDQLVHSDSARLAWFNDRVRASVRAHDHQVIVFTCRPGDYLRGDAGNEASDEDIVTAVDLAAVVSR